MGEGELAAILRACRLQRGGIDRRTGVKFEEQTVPTRFVKEGETLELDAAGKSGEVVLKNAKGRSRTHQPSAAQGIEDDSGALSWAEGGDSGSDEAMRKTKPAVL